MALDHSRNNAKSSILSPVNCMSLPSSIWRSADFDCEKVFNEIFKQMDSFEEIQNVIKVKLEDNTTYFTKHCLHFSENHDLINSSLSEISKICELENERMVGSLERAKAFTVDLDRVAGDIIKLASERKTLTLEITKKRQIQMIINGLDRIDEFLSKRKLDFKEISNLLLATEQLLSQFQSNNSSSNSDETIEFEFHKISVRFDAQRDKISRLIIETFNAGIDETGKLLVDNPTDLFGCCMAADVLDISLRAEIIKIYMEKQYSAYRSLHPQTLNVMELKTLDKRFKWAQRMLNFYEKTFKLAFPSDWQMDILLGQAIGNWIKEDIVAILSAVPNDRRVSEDIFTQALSEANSFDRYISLRFKSAITSSLTQAFQDFHFFLFEAKEDEFNVMRKQILPRDSVKSISKVLKKDHLVMSNFDQFFLFFSGVLDTFAHLSSMSSGVLLVQFSFFLSDSLEILSQYIETQFEIISSLSSKKWSEDIGRLLCCLINTLDYCLSSSQDLIEEILSQIRSDDLKLQVSLESVQQKILVNRSVGLSALLVRYDADLQSVLQNYIKTDWDALAHPIDPSPFYLKFVESLEKSNKFPLPVVIKTLQPQTCRIFLEKFLAFFIQKLQGSLFKFKSVNEIAAEQLMIDLFGFRSYFTQRIIPSSWKAKELALWAQDVTKATSRYELELKVLLTPIEPAAPFVQSYLLLLTDFNVDNFCRFLELKGVTKKAEMQIYIEEFLKHVPPTPQQMRNDFNAPISTPPASHSLFSRLKSSLNVVNAIKRTYTRPIRNTPSDGFLK